MTSRLILLGVGVMALGLAGCHRHHLHIGVKVAENAWTTNDARRAVSEGLEAGLVAPRAVGAASDVGGTGAGG